MVKEVLHAADVSSCCPLCSALLQVWVPNMPQPSDADRCIMQRAANRLKATCRCGGTECLRRWRMERGAPGNLKHPQCGGCRPPVALRSEKLRAPEEGHQRLRKAGIVCQCSCNILRPPQAAVVLMAVHHAQLVPLARTGKEAWRVATKTRQEPVRGVAANDRRRRRAFTRHLLQQARPKAHDRDVFTHIEP